MNKVEQRINWETKPSEKTPINEANLNKMDYALNEIDNRVVKFARQKDAMETATQNASTAATNANTATANATKATESANKATQSATTAANNANEAAQAIFDEKYILTARTEFAKSARVSPTAKGNAILEKLRGDSWQKQLIGKNKFSGFIKGLYINNNTGKEVSSSIGAASDYIEIDLLTNPRYTISGLTDLLSSCVYFYDKDKTFIGRTSSGATTIWKLCIGSTLANDFVLDSNAVYIRIDKYENSSLTGTISLIDSLQVQIEANDTATEYEPYCGGTASPNSDYPQDIRSVGDMGWFDGELRQGTYGEGGNYIAGDGTSVCNVTSIPCKGGDLIAILRDVNATPLIYWWGDNGFISGQSALIGVTAPSDATHFDFVLYSQAGITPSTAGHVCVTINGKYALIVDECNENLFGGDTLADVIVGLGGTKNIDDRTIKWICQDVGTNDIASGLIFLNNTRYTIILYGRCLNTSTNFVNLGIHYTDGTYSELTFTTINTDSYCRYVTAAGKSVESIRFRWGSSGTILYYDKCGIFEGIVSLEDFIEHQSTRHYIPLDEPLRGINDVKDEVCCVDGIYGVLRRTHYVEPTFEKGDLYTDSDSGIKRLCESDALMKPDTTNIICNCASANYWGRNINAVWTYRSVYGVSIDTIQDATNVPEARECIASAGLNIQIIFELATPTFTPFEDQTPFYNLMAYDEVTHVSIAGCHEELNPMATIRFPRNEDGALETTNHCEKQLLKIENKAIRAEIEELTAALLALGRE